MKYENAAHFERVRLQHYAKLELDLGRPPETAEVYRSMKLIKQTYYRWVHERDKDAADIQPRHSQPEVVSATASQSESHAV